MNAEPVSIRSYAARPGRAPLLGAALAVAAFAVTLVLLRHGGVFPDHPGAGGLDAGAVVLAAASTAPLVAWHRLGFWTFVATAAVGILMVSLGYPLDMLLGATAALYLLAAHRSSPWTPGAGVVVTGCFAVYLLAAWARGEFPTSELIHTGLAWAAAWFAGERTRLLREHIADLRQRATRAERETQRERLLAIAEERARIARDLHDSAGHAISLIAVRAGAARLRGDPEQALAALESVETLARQTAAEIDRLVSGLREDGGVAAPAGLGSLSTLIDHHRDAGLEVAIEVSGEPCPVGTVADQAAFRILQEALTNAARHGAGSVRVALSYGEDALGLSVVNPVAEPVGARPGGGHGLIGMRERANLVGGTLEAGRESDRFSVRASIPYGGRAQ